MAVAQQRAQNNNRDVAVRPSELLADLAIFEAQTRRCVDAATELYLAPGSCPPSPVGLNGAKIQMIAHSRRLRLLLINLFAFGPAVERRLLLLLLTGGAASSSLHTWPAAELIEREQ